MANTKQKSKTCSQEENRDETGRFVKGKSGNPSGRPASEWRKQLEKAIAKIAKRKKKPFLDHVIEQAYTDNTVLVAVLRKIIPDKKAIEAIVESFESSMSDELSKAIQDKLKERYE